MDSVGETLMRTTEGQGWMVFEWEKKKWASESKNGMTRRVLFLNLGIETLDRLYWRLYIVK